MAGAGFDLRRGGAIALALALAALTGLAVVSMARAQSGRMHTPFAGGVETGRRAAPPVVGCYEADPGYVFVLDRSNGFPLLRFENSPEIWVLRPVSGPRGDVIYKTDAGRQLLRATSVGGMTLFTADRPAGSAAAFASACPPLRMPPSMSPAALFQRLAAASLRASRAAQHLIEMDADYSTNSAVLTADAGLVASEAMVRLAARPDGRRVTARIGRISIVEGRRPAVALTGGVLVLTITPSMGMAGRLSSDRIMAAVVR